MGITTRTDKDRETLNFSMSTRSSMDLFIDTRKIRSNRVF